MSRIKKSFAVILTMLGTTTLFAQTNNTGMYYYYLGEYPKAKEYLNKDLNANPSENYFYLGEVSFMEGNMQQAEDYYKKGLSSNPENIHNKIGINKLKLKTNAKEAGNVFESFIYDNKKNVDVMVAVGRAYLDNKMIPEAEKYISMAKAVNEKKPEIYILEGDLLVKGNDTKKFGDAAGRYEMATYFAPDYVLGDLKAAQIYEYISPSVAIEKLKSVIGKQPELIVAYDFLGKVYAQNGFYPQAIEIYETYFKLATYSTIDDIERYARSFYFTDQFAEAQKLVDEGLKKEPNHFVLNRYDMYIQAKMKNIDKGLASAQKFFSLRDTSGYIAQDYTMYASILKEAKRYDEAIIQYDKAIKKDADKTEYYAEAASAAREKKDYALAANYVKQMMKKKAALADSPDYEDDVVDINSLGYDYYSAGVNIAKNQPLAEQLMKNEKLISELLAAEANANIDSLRNNLNYFTKRYSLYYLHKADSVFDILIKRIPDSYSGYRFKALTQHAINPETEAGLAKPYYEKVVEIITSVDDPGKQNKRVLLEAYNYLGYYYYMKSDKPNTILYWNKVLEIDPENKNAKLVLDEMNK